MRKASLDGLEICLSAADPLNLIGSVLGGERIGNTAGQRILLRDGLPIAAQVGGEFKALISMTSGDEWRARTRLLRTGSLPAEPEAHLGRSGPRASWLPGRSR